MYRPKFSIFLSTILAILSLRTNNTSAMYTDGRLNLGVEDVGTRYSSSHEHLNKYIIVDDNSIVNATLTYAVCDGIVPKIGNSTASFRSNRYGRKKCVVYLEDPSSELKCEIELRTSKISTIDYDRIRVVPFGSDKAIISYWSSAPYDLWKHDVVHFDDCNVYPLSDAKLDKMKEVTFVTRHGKSFVDAVGYDDNTCSSVYCKIRLDDRGKVMLGRRAWFYDVVPPIPHERLQLLPVDSDDDYLVIEEFLRSPGSTKTVSGHVALIRADGSMMSLKNYTSSANTKSHYKPLVYSVSHETIVVCTQLNRKITCDQFDLSGRSKASTTVVTDEYESHEMAVHNLPDGNLLLMTAQCKNSLCEGDHGHRYHVRVIKAGDNGILAESKFHKSRCNAVKNNARSQFFENEMNQYCLSSLCYSEERLLNDSRDRKNRALFRLDVTCVLDPRFWT